MNKLRVWHIPQVPMKPFIVEVETLQEGVNMLKALANYDLFQYENNIKPDYCNMNGLQMWDESLTEEDLIEMELEDKWVDWFIDHEEYGCFEDPEEYLSYKQDMLDIEKSINKAEQMFM